MKLAGYLALLVISAFSETLRCQTQEVQDERSVKAAFVFNLTKYVEWPPGGELIICAVGESDMTRTLQKSLAGKPSEARTIRVMLSPSENQMALCQMAFIAYSSPKSIRAALEKFRNKSVLTVGDAAPFAQTGGMIGLVRNGDRIQIEINMEAVQEARLKLSSRLLNVAVLVHSAPAGRD
jgi:hypothetical protein